MAGMTLIVRTIGRLLFPFLSLFGIYVLVHGHLTPGGGFQGGVIIAASVIMLWLAYGLRTSPLRFRLFRTEELEAFAGLSLLAIGLFGLVLGVGKFFGHVLPLGGLGQLFSGGDLPLLNLWTALKVLAGLLLIFYGMFRTLGGYER